MASNGKNPAGGLLSGRTLLGSKVENPRGKGLGRIEDIMISAEDGRIAYAVVSFGGFLSIGNKLFAFPWSALHVDGPKKRITLDVDQEALAKARGFEKGQWPDSSDWHWDTGIPSPNRSAPAAPQPATPGVASGILVVPVGQDAPSLGESPGMEPAASSKNRMEQWGKSWQSHGLNRP